MRGQVNMVDEAKLCGTLHSTFEVLAVWCVAGCCCGGKSSPFCWPMAAAGNAVFSASYWFAKHTSQMKWFHMASESYSGSDWQQTTQQWPWLLFGGNRSLGKCFGASFQFNHWASCCCLSYKIHLLQKSYNKPRQQIKKQRHHFTNKGPSSQSYGFSSSHVQIWELDHGKGWAPKNWCFRVVVLEKTLESPSDSKETKPVKSKGNQPWIFIGRPDAEAETPILWPSDVKNWLFGKDPDAGKDWRQKETGTLEGEMVGLAPLTWWTWVWATSRWWTGRPGMLWFMGSKGVGHDRLTELNWVIKSCLTLCDPMYYSMPGFPILHCLQSLLKLMSIESVTPSK